MIGVIAALLNVVYCYCHLCVVDDDSVSVSVSSNEFHAIFLNKQKLDILNLKKSYLSACIPLLYKSFTHHFVV